MDQIVNREGGKRAGTYKTMSRAPNPINWTLAKALAPDVIQRAVGQIEVAMGHGNREEALRAVERAFEGEREKVTRLSSVNDLEMLHRLACILEARGIAQVGQLCQHTQADLQAMRGLNRLSAVRIRLALRREGFRLRNKRVELRRNRYARAG